MTNEIMAKEKEIRDMIAAKPVGNCAGWLATIRTKEEALRSLVVDEIMKKNGLKMPTLPKEGNR